MIEEEIKNKILDIIFKYLSKNNTSIFLIGSNADNTATYRSDIDIVIHNNTELNDKTFLEIFEELNNNVDTLRKIDLLDYNNLDDKFREFSLKQAIKWY